MSVFTDLWRSPPGKSAAGPVPASSRVTLAVVAVLHVIALAVILRSEYGPFAITMALLAWVLLNSLFVLMLRRPALAALFSAALAAIIIALSQFKFGVLQLTLTFLDFLLIDRDTFSFLFAVVPNLRWRLIVAAVIAVPLVWAMWRLDPYRIRRLQAAATIFVSMGAIAGLSVAMPEQPWEPFQGVNHISNLARSGATSVAHLLANGWIDADAAPAAPLPAAAPCKVEKPPHIVMVLDESSFDIASAPGIKVPPGYADYFRSFDGKRRTLLPEATGGPTWYTEYNVLAGLSSRSFGKLRFYLTRIAAGNITRGLPQSLRRCGYRTFSLYPTYGDFLGARTFQTGLGVDEFIDMAAMGVNEDMQPDSFYFDQALKRIGEARTAGGPLFMFVYLTANHFPWTETYRPDLTPGWQGPGNTAEVDEYIRRQAMTANDYRAFVERLKRDYPDDAFLLVRFGDHQPAISHKLMEPGMASGSLAKQLLSFDPRYYATYYAFDTINFSPPDISAALPVLDAAYLPLVVQEAAGLPLDPSFAAQKKIMQRCGGLFYGCDGGKEARRFNRLLMDSGFIKNL
jgi:hypothetical protein